MQSVKIGQINGSTKNGIFKSEFPNELQGVIFKKEFSNSMKILNKYKLGYGKILILYIFIIIIGFGLSVGGGFNFVHKAENDEQAKSKRNIGVALISTGIGIILFGFLLTIIYAYTRLMKFKKNIKKQLEIFNEKPIFKSRSIVWSLDHTQSNNKQVDHFYIIITFPASIERLEEPPELIEHVPDYSVYYPTFQNQNQNQNQIPNTTTPGTIYFNYDFRQQTVSSSSSSSLSSSSSTSATESIHSPSPSQPQPQPQPIERNNIEMHSIDIDIDPPNDKTNNNNNNNNNNNYNVKYCIKCTDHPDEILKLFCVECKIEICSDCTLTGESHYGHKYNKINKNNK